MTNKQREEICFLVEYYNLKPTDAEVDEFVDITTNGIGNHKGKFGVNPIYQAKRKFNIQISMWKTDIQDRIISVEELKNESDNPYFKKLISKLW